MALVIRSAMRQDVYIGLQSGRGIPATNFNHVLVEKIELKAEPSAKIEINYVKPSLSKTGSVNIGGVYKGTIDSPFSPNGVDLSNIPISLNYSPLFQSAGLLEKTNTNVLSISTSSTYVIGETVQSAASTSVTGIVSGKTNGKIFLTQVAGDFGTATSVVGLTSSATSTIGTVLPSIAHALNSDFNAAKYVTIKHNIDGILQTAYDVQNSIKFSAKDSDVLRCNIGNITGIYTDPVSIPLGAFTCPTMKPEIQVNPLTLLWDSYDTSTFVVSNVDIDLGNTVSPLNDSQSENSIVGVIINDRKPTISISLSAPQLSDFNPFLSAKTDATHYMSLGFNLNGNAGERVIMFIKAAQWEFPSPKEDKGVAYWDVTGTLTGCVDDEFVLFIY